MVNAGQEDPRFVFTHEAMETEHVQLQRKQAAQVRKETIMVNKLKASIKKQMERGPLNLSMPDRNLYIAKLEYTMDDLRNINKRKMK